MIKLAIDFKVTKIERTTPSIEESASFTVVTSDFKANLTAFPVRI